MLLGSYSPMGSVISCTLQAMTNLICGFTLRRVLRQSWFPTIQDSLHVASSMHHSPSRAGPSSCEISLSSSSGNWSSLKTHTRKNQRMESQLRIATGKGAMGQERSKAFLSPRPFCYEAMVTDASPQVLDLLGSYQVMSNTVRDILPGT